MKSDEFFYLPTGQYSPTFLKLLAMANHMGLISPPELTFFWDSGWDQNKIAALLWKRVQEGSAKQ